MVFRLFGKCAFVTTVLAVLLLTFFAQARGAGPRASHTGPCPGYAISPKFARGTFSFAGETIPLERPDVAGRIRHQVNFLLMDARSVLFRWLSETARHGWLFEEILKREDAPREFALLAPILSSLSTKTPTGVGGAGWWALDQLCTQAEGVPMTRNAFIDDRMDVESATRCFAVRIKRLKADLGKDGWLMAAAAYLSSAKTVSETAENWDSGKFWDLPLPETAETLVVRWISFHIINGDRSFYGLEPDSPPALTYDQVAGLTLAKDLTVAHVARITGLSPRGVLDLNPKIHPSKGALPAMVDGKRLRHTLAVPKGKGASVVAELTKSGYLMEDKGR